MTEMILPGVYIDVRPEGLITPGRVGVGNVGVVGTASRGPVGQPVRLGSYAEARARFGDYDAWTDGTSDELTLVRALELVFSHGATTVIAVRVAAADPAPAPAPASTQLAATSGAGVTLRARTPGTWGDNLRVNVWDAEEPPFIEQEDHGGAAAITLTHPPVLNSARNRVSQYVSATGFHRSLAIVYDDTAGPPTSGQVKIDRDTGQLTFPADDPPDPADTVRVSYATRAGNGVLVTVRLVRGQEVAAQEVYTVVSGTDLVRRLNSPLSPSALLVAEEADHPAETPAKSATASTFLPLRGGTNGAGAGAGDYRDGLDRLLNEDAHIIVAAGQDQSFGDELDAHCQNASTDTVKRDRIGVLGSGVGSAGQLDAIRGHNLASDRIVFVAPGILVTDPAATGQPQVALPGAYTAAAVAGLLSRYPAHVSLTNKPLSVGGPATVFTRPELAQLLDSRVLAVEQRQGIRVVRAITTATNTAWQQITTRRIVDYTKFGVRSAAEPYIGLLNNDRVRAALRATVNSFLTEMVDAEMLVSYQLDVSASRDEEIKGIARVTVVLRPVFSIDFIKVTMFL